MQNRTTLGVIGGGFMAHAIVSGALSSGFLAAGDILVSEPDLVRRDGFIKLGVRVTQENAETAACDFLLLAVKPQVFVEAVASLRHADRLPVVISIMAGKTRRAIRQSLPSAKIARVMPNLPCAVGAGMAGMDTSELSGEERVFVERLFRSVGQTAEVEEALLDAVTGISGSGPAYVYLFLRALIRAGVAHGLTEERAKQLALQTIAGGVEMARRSERSPDELIAAVSSKGGTTVAALESFREDDFEGSVLRAVDAAVCRAKELSE